MVALASAALVLLPVIYITTLALSAHPAVWSRLWTTRVPELLWNTISLAGAVVLLALVLGISTAWIVTRCDFPGRRLWEVALVLPLAMPTFVLAYVFNYLLGFGGPVEALWQMLAGPQARIFSPQSFLGVTVVMGLATFPFIYLLTRSALLNFNVSFEEVARTCGASPLRRIVSVTLPLLRPSIVAAVALVILYVVSDFGAVSLLRYQSTGIQVHVRLMGDNITWMIENNYEEEVGIEDGDLFLSNDPVIAGVHAADNYDILPIFWKQELIGWVVTAIMEMDIGAVSPACMPTANVERGSDGLKFCCERVGSNDKLNRDFQHKIEMSLDMPDIFLLDRKGAIAANIRVREEMKNVIREFGLDYYKRATREIIEEERRNQQARIHRHRQ